MIVVGGWPGRNVAGLNGRFGVRQSELASGGPPSPFANNFDVGDAAATEMVVVVTALPASGTVTLTDDGDFTHTGGADGTYATLGTVYSWAPGGPLVAHATPESISSTFGTGVATPVGIALESQAAQALAGRHIRSAGLAVEAGVAFALMPHVSGAVGLAVEACEAFSLSSAMSGLVGVAVDAEAALALSVRQIAAVGMAVEAGVAFSLAMPTTSRLYPLAGLTQTFPLSGRVPS